MSIKNESNNPPNPLGISWHDSTWINVLDGSNVLEYFSDRSNPFYDRMSNNETIRMQRLDPEVMNDMTGLEYILLHVQDPILYIIRKQHRHSRTQVTPQADYYVLAGVVYQAPDLNTALNSRLLSTVFHLQGAFEQTHSFSRYHPSRGYWWDFGKEEEAKKEKASDQKENGSLFQRRRVDLLLGELARRFPPKIAPPLQQAPAAAAASAPATATAPAGTAATTAAAATTATAAAAATGAASTGTAGSAGVATPTQNGNATSAANNSSAGQLANQKPGVTRPAEGGNPEKRARLN